MGLGISANLEPAGWRVKLTVSDTTAPAVPSVTWPVTVTATYGGQSYIVRGTPLAAPTPPLVGWDVYDYDCPLNVDVTYTARDAIGMESNKPVVRLNSADFVLSSLVRPGIFAYPTVISDQSQTWEGRSIPHDILGTPEPLVTMAVAAYRSGTFRIWAPTLEGFVPTRDLLLSGDVLLLRSPCTTEIADTAFVMETMTADLPWKTAPQRPRDVNVAYRAVRRDTGPPRSTPWTFDTVKATYATFSALPTVFASFAALAQGPDPISGRSAPAAADAGAQLGW